MVDSRIDSAEGALPMRFGHRVFWLLGFFILEVTLLAVAYQFLARIECQGTEAESLCRGLRSLVARAMAVLAVAAVLAWARPGLAKRVLNLFASHPGPRSAILLHVLGMGLLLAPLAIAGGADMSPIFMRLAPFWGIGALLTTVGALLWLAPPRSWRLAAGNEAGIILAALAVGLLLPDLADLILPLWWHWPQLTTLTFQSVAAVLSLTGQPVYVDAPGYIIGVGEFFVHIAQQCSGVEGLALVTGFTVIYAVLMGRQLRMSRYWLLVLPLGLLLSWVLNVLRIAALIVIGDRISPEVAVDGFHSYAGWLFFTLLALGLMAFVQATPWLHRLDRPVAPASPLRRDWLAARILPFIAFMMVSTLTSAFFIHAELGYPIKTVVMLLALLLFLPAYRSRDWAPQAVPLLAGLAVGAFWIWTAPGETMDGFVLSQLLSSLPPAMLVIWIVARTIGTIALVPVIEELFFRGYVLARLDRGGMVWRLVALAVSSLLFGLLHGRLIEASLAGLVFGALMLWRGRIADAVWAHVAANAVVAMVALMRGDWALI